MSYYEVRSYRRHIMSGFTVNVHTSSPPHGVFCVLWCGRNEMIQRLTSAAMVIENWQVAHSSCYAMWRRGIRTAADTSGPQSRMLRTQVQRGICYIDYRACITQNVLLLSLQGRVVISYDLYVDTLLPIYHTLLHAYAPIRSLRSSSAHQLVAEPRLRTTLASRGFRSAGPRIGNSLPNHIELAPSLFSFRSKLNTHLFTSIAQ